MTVLPHLSPPTSAERQAAQFPPCKEEARNVEIGKPGVLPWGRRGQDRIPWLTDEQRHLCMCLATRLPASASCTTDVILHRGLGAKRQSWRRLMLRGTEGD